MACRLFGPKPLTEPMLISYRLDPKKQTSVKFESKFKIFYWRKCIIKGIDQNIYTWYEYEITN